MTSNPLVSGLPCSSPSYVVTYVVFVSSSTTTSCRARRSTCNRRRKGMFNGVSALVFYVTALAVMFLVLCFDLWPLTLFPAVMKQPVLGLVWTRDRAGGCCAGDIDWHRQTRRRPDGLPHAGDGAVHLRIDHRVEHAPELALREAGAAAQGRVEHRRRGGDRSDARALYVSLSPLVIGRLASGPPGYELEIWLANALLSVTFPFLIYHAAFFGYWPLVGASGSRTQREAASATKNFVDTTKLIVDTARMARRNFISRPTDAELDILRVLWARGPSTVRQVHDVLSANRDFAYTTTLKLLQLMTEKGVAMREEDGRVHLYRAAVAQEETQRHLIRDLLDRAFGGSPSQLVMQALAAKPASAEELQEIRRLLAEHEEKER